MNTAIKQPSIRRVALGCDTPTVEWLQPLDAVIIAKIAALFNIYGTPTERGRSVARDFRTTQSSVGQEYLTELEAAQKRLEGKKK